MQIQIKNIWKIKEATVNLEWLSVIAGNNDTWKSTISKIVFCIIKAFQKYEEFSNISKEEIIKKYIERLYIHTRVIISFLKDDKKNSSSDINKIAKKLKNEFEPDIFFEKFTWSDDKLIFLDKKRKFLKELEIPSALKENAYELLSKIEEEYLKEETKEYLIKKALNQIFDSEFNWKLNQWKNKWEIVVYDKLIKLFHIIIENNEIDINIYDEFLQINDATFINSPIILDFFNTRLFHSLQYHYEDLFNKINNIPLNIKERENWFWKKLKNTIKWSFELVNSLIWKKLKFKKDNIEEDIEVINTATWIKAFWILDLLDKWNYLWWNNLLILDEPEVHLHPQWQVEYAKLIVYLIKKRGLTVLISSHSPYIIEALNKFSKKENIKANFYLAEEDRKWKVKVFDKTDSKYEIFEKLSKPFRELMLD